MRTGLAPHDKRAKAVGRRGEVATIRHLLLSGYPVLHGLIVPFNEQSATEVDIVALLGGTIVAFEVKAHGGVIHVTPGSQWVRYRNGAEPLRFYDPTLQNRTHLHALATHVGNVPLAGIVLFTASPAFRPARPKGVITWAELDARLAEIAASVPPTDRARKRFMDLARFHLHSDRSLLEDAHTKTLSRAARSSWLQTRGFTR